MTATMSEVAMSWNSDLVNERYRERLERTGESPEQFAAAVNISLSLIYKLRSDPTADPSVSRAFRLALALGVPITDLYSEE